jgi:hypothetical protein
MVSMVRKRFSGPGFAPLLDREPGFPLSYGPGCLSPLVAFAP